MTFKPVCIQYVFSVIKAKSKAVNVWICTVPISVGKRQLLFFKNITSNKCNIYLRYFNILDILIILNILCSLWLKKSDCLEQEL